MAQMGGLGKKNGHVGELSARDLRCAKYSPSERTEYPGEKYIECCEFTIYNMSIGTNSRVDIESIGQQPESD